VLPLKKSAVRKLAVAGRLATLENTGDNGSSRVRPPYVMTSLAGLKEFLDEGVAVFAGDESDALDAASAAARADAAVVVVGLTAAEEGEWIPGDMGGAPESGQGRRGAVGGDRDNLGLAPEQIKLIRAVAGATRRTVVVVVGGSAIMMNEWIDEVGAVLQTFYSGMEGGRALARLLFGEVSPSGRLPFTVPKAESDLPFFDKNADTIEYGPYHGYTLLEKAGTEPAFAFGYGLSYSSFGYRALKVRKAGDRLQVQVSVTNRGAVAADEVAQVYVGFPGKVVDRPKKLLRGFERLTLKPAETRTVRLEVPLDSLCWYDATTRSWKLESGAHTVYAGGSSRDRDLVRAAISL
ncbi:MAG TPA: glycoside hydrolase family 3 C-terminal domain-containing protein, partial [Candidatus Binataceae bacterium]|nr:glycoside hydrolase family 3 C-terminal domain-containing protein [Candidatus Binataceae bacterium]